MVCFLAPPALVMYRMLTMQLASHATAKLPGFTATASGVTRDNPDRAGGSWDQTVGAAKETVGGLVGSEVCFALWLPQFHHRHQQMD